MSTQARPRNVVAIIQARMGSSRLPNKILMPVLGKPLLGWMLERVRRCPEINEVVIATTTDPRDDVIERFAREQDVAVVRGSEQDVLARHQQAAQDRGADVVVRITSDCPLLDPQVLGRVIRGYFESGADFYSNSEPLPSTWPDGMDVSVFSAAHLAQADREATKPSEREHVTFFFWNNPQRFTCAKLEHESDFSRYRVTLDYAEDFELFRRVIEHFGADGPQGVLNVSMEQIAAWLDANPEVFALNARYSHGVGWASAFARDAQQQSPQS